MADSIRKTLKEDNPQLYKLYDDKRHADRRILVDQQMNVVLTTMHKVKGLEFDAVIITPSVTSLPFNPNEDIDVSLPLSNSDIEQIEEEQRLLYVAYTRAKKFLFVYKGNRELAVETMQRFASLEDQWGIRERRVGLDNYNIGYNAGYNYKNNNSIVYNVKKNDPLSIRRYKGITRGGVPFATFNIVHNGIDGSVLLYKIVHLRDIGVAQALQHVHLPPQRICSCLQGSLVRFEHYLLPQAQMVRQIDISAASGTNLLILD